MSEVVNMLVCMIYPLCVLICREALLRFCSAFERVSLIEKTTGNTTYTSRKNKGNIDANFLDKQQYQVEFKF